MNNKAWIGAGLGCFASCVIIAVVSIVTGSSIFTSFLAEPENVDINVETPSQVTTEQSFVIKVSVDNLSTEAQYLDSIDFTTSYLEGIIIEDTQPAYTESYLLDMSDLIAQYQVYEFRKQIPGNEGITVQFFAVPVMTGDYSGEIDVCINSGSRCHTSLVRTIVR